MTDRRRQVTPCHNGKLHTPTQNSISQYPLAVKLQFKGQQIQGCFPNHEKRVVFSLSNSVKLIASAL